MEFKLYSENLLSAGVGKRVARSPEAGRYSAGLVDSDSHIARRASDILERAYRIFNEHITESFVPPSFSLKQTLFHDILFV